MIELFKEVFLHWVNWVAALFMFSLIFPQYEHTAGLVAILLGVLALEYVFLASPLPEDEEASA
jgi:hypothetical protein